METITNFAFTRPEDFLLTFTDDDHAEIGRRDAVFQQVTQNYTVEMGQKASRAERSEKNIDAKDMTYGEIEYKSFSQVFKWVQKKHNVFNTPGGTFCDLGHGTGKGLLSGAFMH